LCFAGEIGSSGGGNDAKAYSCLKNVGKGTKGRSGVGKRMIFVIDKDYVEFRSFMDYREAAKKKLRK
jgi:hypothetical protein